MPLANDLVRGCAAVLMLFPTAAIGAAALKVASVTEFSQLPTPLPYPFNETANADDQVNSALARAEAQHKLAFIDLGANWCADCRILASIMELPEVKQFVEAKYVVVQVDVGRLNRNLQIPARWGITGRLEGIPAVLIVDPSDNSLIDRSNVTTLVEARHMTPQGIADWIAKWVR